MRRLLLIPALAVAVATGCGGSDDKGSSSVPTAAGYPSAAKQVTSKKQYIAQADAACAELNARIKSLPNPKSKKDVVPVYRQIAAEAQAFYDAFKAIPKRPQDEQILTKYQQNLARSLSVTKQVPAAFEANDKQKLSRLYAEARTLQREDRTIAKRYGFKVCGASA
jgi:hypothetical protein